MNSISKVDLDLIKEKYQGESLDIALNKIKEGYPVQYIIGNVNFCGNTILVNENVLIPRYETEFLVDLIIKKISNTEKHNILDIGTGSGCISISLSKKLSNSQITGIDISSDAIILANKNKELNKSNNVNFINKDLFEISELKDYDIIVSNPPYVSYDETVGEETKYEPQNAIFADNKGLIFYEEIIKKVSLTNNVKHIFFEIGMNQAEEIKNFRNIYLPNFIV